MSWFSRNELADKVSALEQENESLRADLAVAQAAENQVPVITQEVAGLKEDLQSIKDALTAEESAHAATKQELETVKAELEPAALASKINAAANSEEEADAPIKEAIQKEVANAIAGTGHAPLDTAKGEQETAAEKTLTGEAFAALSPQAQNTFYRSGGKIIA